MHSTSQTVCHLDLDRMLLKRAHGAGSQPMPHDDEWVSLVRIASIGKGDTGVVRVGDRHEYLTDPGAWSSDYRWWIPRTCAAIERAPRTSDAVTLAHEPPIDDGERPSDAPAPGVGAP